MKAYELVFQEAKRNINILKFVFWDDGTFVFTPESAPFDYCFSIDGSNFADFGEGGRSRAPPLIRDAWHDDIVRAINLVFNKPARSTIESRIIDAIEILGMADSNTPIHIKFLLRIMALEGLLLTEKDNIASKLAERISYLIGDSKEWLQMYKGLLSINKMSFDEKVTDEILLARVSLDKIVKTLYTKRSGFAHGGLSDEKKTISLNDYHLVSFILRQVMLRLIALSQEITHISDSTGEKILGDIGSLDVYIKKKKYQTKS
jgi:hypothetical protein